MSLLVFLLVEITYGQGRRREQRPYWNSTLHMFICLTFTIFSPLKISLCLAMRKVKLEGGEGEGEMGPVGLVVEGRSTWLQVGHSPSDLPRPGARHPFVGPTTRSLPLGLADRPQARQAACPTPRPQRYIASSSTKHMRARKILMCRKTSKVTSRSTWTVWPPWIGAPP